MQILGIQPGEQVGKVLLELKNAQYEKKIRTKEEAKNLLLNLFKFYPKDFHIYLEIAKTQGKWDIFITGENRENPRELAKKCIGFRSPNNGLCHNNNRTYR